MAGARINVVVIMIGGIEVGTTWRWLRWASTKAAKKHPLGVYLGVTENGVVCSDLLNNLGACGIDPPQSYHDAPPSLCLLLCSALLLRSPLIPNP